MVAGGIDKEVIFLLNAVAFDEGDYEAAGRAVVFFERPAIGRVVFGQIREGDGSFIDRYSLFVNHVDRYGPLAAHLGLGRKSGGKKKKKKREKAQCEPHCSN